MPGEVQLAVPTTVMPKASCQSFSRLEFYPFECNVYKNGESQRNTLATQPRRRWQLGLKLNCLFIVEMKNFYFSVIGTHKPFWFYDLQEFPGSFDASGASPEGRYTVRFDGPWEEAFLVGSFTTNLQLLEIR